ncbi:MAG: nucleoside triphosphate pyrophosphohydrolase [Chloroflexi bacterium]|nr:nucleoside triphosphate pyrophosphohydrolase [Chloroflexota bacterium]
MTLTIVGLGPGSADDVTRNAWRAIENAPLVYVRTAQHPCVPDLPAVCISFDNVYDTIPDFEGVYTEIAARVIDAALVGDVVYAVPGHPLVAEATVKKLLERAQTEHIGVEIVDGISFIEPILTLIGIDAIDGFQLYDAIDVAALHHPPINPDYPALLGQVYSRDLASNLKLTLMNQYPDDFQVRLIHAAGTPEAVVETVSLFEIDRSEHIEHLTALYLPALGNKSSFEEFQEVIAHLRAPEGCPWDRKQTHESLRKYLLEETYEVLEAIDEGDADHLIEELGDVLLQIGLHAQIAADDGEFRMADIISRLNKKLIFRHPHVWGDVLVENAENVVQNWEALKKQEQAEGGKKQRESLLDGVPKGLPALMQGYEYQEKAAKAGFDWWKIDDVLAKVREEFDEVLTATSDTHRAEEMGDLLFVIVNWARWLKIEPETALREANAKFYRRFHYIEEKIAPEGKPMNDYPLPELDAIWDEAKAKGL